MDKNLQQRVETLEKQMMSLNNSNTITYQVQNAFSGRGFVQNNLFVAGHGEMSVIGEYTLIIPGLTKNSILLASTGNGPITSTIRVSVTAPPSLEIYLTGVAGTPFDFVVFLFDSLYVRI